MSPRNKRIQIVLSLIVTILFIQLYLKKKESKIQGSFENVKVLVAARDIPPRTSIKERDVTIASVPIKYVSPGSVLAKDEEAALQQVKGMVSVGSISEGAQMVMSNLVEPSTKETGIAPQVPQGKRGYVLRLGNLDVYKLILPGDYVDVMVTFPVRRPQGSYNLTTTILQNILVVSVGKELKRPTDTDSGKVQESVAMTLALAPEEAQNLTLAQAESGGQISIIVRGRGDHKIHSIQPMTPGTLLR